MNINLKSTDSFANRHIGPAAHRIPEMLEKVGVNSLEELIDQTVPASIRMKRELDLPEAMSEFNYLRMLREKASRNKLYRSYIGLGYYGTIVPAPIQRNILENPGWYTQYTPYQAEIAQGRLEALLNYQTMISDMTGMELANASLLDEGTAAAEAMLMLFHVRNKRVKDDSVNRFLVTDKVLPQTLEVLETRAEPLGIQVEVMHHEAFDLSDDVFGCYVQYPGADGEVHDYTDLCAKAHENNTYVVFGADLLALTLLKSPGEMGADVVVGNSQRFGVPMGFGGPHAGFFACKDEFKRQVPGRIIGVSRDVEGKIAFRMALQTREQHIKREKATSNICTAQALLAIMSGMYAVYHGPNGLRNIGLRVHLMTRLLSEELTGLGFRQTNEIYFDTLKISLGDVSSEQIFALADAAGINFRYEDESTLTLSLDETTQPEDLEQICNIFAQASGQGFEATDFQAKADQYELSELAPANLLREVDYLSHQVFNRFHSETELMRYIKQLEMKDLSLTTSMISLGSCTMKLNAAAELMPVSWPEFNSIHPFVPADQVEGYLEIISELEEYLAEITGFTATSLQPNSGAQGEYAGLMVIRAYHLDRGDEARNVALIPSSAHGTNPASAVMAGMQVVVVKCDEMGNIEVDDLREKAEQYKDNLSCLMVTYPSTHGVFEEAIIEICQIVHDNGGLVYMDGANMNAQVGLTSPAIIGADVCHLNLHKTFAIPHGGGGPGMGPICVNDKLKAYLPGHIYRETGGGKAIQAVSAAPFGSASILLISYGYIRMLGKQGVVDSTRFAILNANYLKSQLEKDFKILYVGKNNRVAHEFIMDFRMFKQEAGVDVADVAKRLMDYGYHAPTVSFPVAGTMMIEPTESENIDELDRFIEAMQGIRKEIQNLQDGKLELENSPLKNAPHTAPFVLRSDWDMPYSREEAAFPADYLLDRKFWPAVRRIDDSFGDRNLMCICPPISEYMDVLPS